MIFIPKYTVIDAQEVSDDIDIFREQLTALHINFCSITIDRQNVDGNIVNGYTVTSRNDKSVFIQIGHLMFSFGNVLHIVEDTETFLEFYTKSEKPISKKRVRNKEKYVCSECGYIDTKSFDKCPKCGTDSDTCRNLQVVSKNTRKRKENNMENPNNDLIKAREEAELEESKSEVTAVYGDNVSAVVTSEVPSNNK